jgi:hypothetical protein
VQGQSNFGPKGHVQHHDTKRPTQPRNHQRATEEGLVKKAQGGVLRRNHLNKFDLYIYEHCLIVLNLSFVLKNHVFLAKINSNSKPKNFQASASSIA